MKFNKELQELTKKLIDYVCCKQVGKVEHVIYTLNSCHDRLKCTFEKENQNCTHFLNDKIKTMIKKILKVMSYIN